MSVRLVARAKPLRQWRGGVSAVSLGLFAAMQLATSAAHAYDEPYRLLGGKFDVSTAPVPYALNPAGSDDVSPAESLDAVRAAFRAWTCVSGTALRVVEEGEGVAEASLEDGINTVFWDETGDFGLGPGTLGVAQAGGDGNGRQADIIFNGSDHTWSVNNPASATDIGSIALHEIGHFLGLDHPCDQDEQGTETNCNASDVTIMAPAWDGVVVRVPLPDDEQGIIALYPATNPEARCDGPYQLGEKCACDDECIEGLACIPDTEGVPICAQLCSGENAACAVTFECVLGAPEGDEAPQGACVKSPEGGSPTGAVCTSNGQCESNNCGLVPTIGRSVCREPCTGDGDCAEGAQCIDNTCLLGASGIPCEEDPPPQGCNCKTADGTGAAAPALALALSVLWLWRRRRGDHV